VRYFTQGACASLCTTHQEPNSPLGAGLSPSLTHWVVATTSTYRVPFDLKYILLQTRKSGNNHPLHYIRTRHSSLPLKGDGPPASI
jgi:hypothetical protein